MPASAPGRTATAADGPARASFRRFLAVGGSVTAVQYALLAALIDGLRWWPVASSALAYAFAVVLNYELSRRFTFFGRPAAWGSFARFVVASALGGAVNVTVFWAALRAGAPHWLIAQALATGVAMGVNFTVYRHWAFAR